MIFVFDKKIISIALVKNIPRMRIFLIDSPTGNCPESFKRKTKMSFLGIAAGLREFAVDPAHSHDLTERIINDLEKETEIFSVGYEEEKAE